MTVRTGVYRFSDFLELVQEDQKADLLDGVIYMASPENFEHNKIVLWLAHLLDIYVRERGLGEVTVNKVAYRLGDLHGPEPDVAFVVRERKGIIRHGYVDGPPDVAVEVVSPDSVDRDYEHKRARYEDAGVREYWIIDPDETRATFLQLQDGKYAEIQPQQGVFRSTTVPGFWFEVDALWRKPLPSALRAVQAMLAP